MTELENKIAKTEAYLSSLYKQKEEEDKKASEIKQQIETLENEVVEKNQELENKTKELENIEFDSKAYENASDAAFDGVKIIADPDNPFPLSFPMKVYANQFYSISINDGIKQIITVYACFQTGIVTEENIEDYLTPMEF